MSRSVAIVLAAVLALTTSVDATWSIVLVDTETGEVGVGTVTCLNNFNLLAIVPVVVVGEGAAAVQAAGDFDGIRRPIIFDGFVNGVDPDDMLVTLSGITGHQSRQYGIVDTQGRALTFTGTETLAWAGGVTGQDGTLVYAIQGNILAGACVVEAIETAVLATPGDMAARLMAGMEAARATGGDGRCSCSTNDATGCGCPVPIFDKSGHIGTMVIARPGNADDPNCNASGCADGSYYMKFNVAFQSNSDPDPVFQLQSLFDDWRADLIGLPDAIESQVTFDPPFVPGNGVTSTTMRIELNDWQGLPITAPTGGVLVNHAQDSAGLATIGRPVDQGGGVYEVEVTAGTGTGVDRFAVQVLLNPLLLLVPNAALEHVVPGDIDGDGAVTVGDLLALLGVWGPCSPGPCPADVDGNGSVDVGDLLLLLGNWT